MNPRGVPVVMYHSVGPARPDWQWNYLVTPLKVFEGQMRLLAEKGWTTITLSQLHSHMERGVTLPEKPVVLTFDDGYLDNWVYAFPVLKKYRHRAAIWVSTDFIDPTTDLRPTLDDIWGGRIGRDELADRGYLSWREMGSMIESGLVEIQSHAKTHTWYFNGPEIVDFHRPTGIGGYNPPPWLAWNLFPDRKYESMSVGLEKDIPYGTPIYQHGKSLAIRRYFEDAGLTSRIVERVAESGGSIFFEREDWRRELLGIAEAYPSRDDRIETQEEYEERVRNELVESRQAIKAFLGAGGDFLCWPGGARSPVTLRIAAEAGYLATTTHYEDRSRRNVFGQDPSEINRIGCASPWVWRPGIVIRHTDPELFIAALEYFAGKKNSIWTMRRYKLKYLLRYYLTGVS